MILVEGNATTVSAFKAAWFGSASFAGVKVGTYSGSGVGLSTGGDGVNLFDALHNRVTGVSFGASTDKVTFDNTERAATLTTLSVRGRNGSCVAGGELGSPGTIAPDTTAPTVTYSGNAGTYTVDQTVHITCAAEDEPRGSGVASATCAEVTGADTFGLGTHAVIATATDFAGNVDRATVSFAVVVTPASLYRLTRQFVDGSAKYGRLTARQQSVLDKTVDALCAANLTPITAKTKPLPRALLVAGYKVGVALLASDGWLTRAQATELAGFATKL